MWELAPLAHVRITVKAGRVTKCFALPSEYPAVASSKPLLEKYMLFTQRTWPSRRRSAPLRGSQIRTLLSQEADA